MLDRLPPELLLRILRHAAPLEYTPDKHVERRRVLRSLSLVNKRISEAAKPMLPEVMALCEESGLLLLAATDGARMRGSSVKLLVVRNDTYPAANLSFALLLCPNVVDLRILRVYEVKMDHLPSRLQRLSVVQSHLHPPAKSTFPCLLELSLAATRVSEEFLKQFPTPTTAPNLRALALNSVRIGFGEGIEVTGADLNQGTVAKLQALNLDAIGNSAPRPAFLTASPPAIRIYFSLPLDSDKLKNDFANKMDRLADKLVASPSPLRLLVFPKPLQPLMHSSSAIRVAMTKVVQAAEAKDVEVVWEEQPDWLYEPLVSPFFWERTKRIEQK
ncbi:hypothetical protein JCM8097_003987 [Rhodosporidiobolus ruineniae]